MTNFKDYLLIENNVLFAQSDNNYKSQPMKIQFDAEILLQKRDPSILYVSNAFYYVIHV